VASIISNEIAEILQEFMNPKFMVTMDSSNEPNIALVMTWTVYEGDSLVYGDFMTYKTRQNLRTGNNRIGLVVMTLGLDNWCIKADFESFHQNDEVYEFMAMTPLFRYNQYTNARGAGVANAIWASQNYKISKLSVLSSFLKAKLAARKVEQIKTEEGNMPGNVFERFSKMAAVKVISFIDEDGYPIGFPALGMLPSSTNRLIIDRGEEIRRGFQIHDGQRVAISLVTTEPAAFQVKGTFRELSSTKAIVDIDRVYACSLPRPGVRVDIPMLTPDSSLKSD
jgi:hypothetical protein